MVDAQGQAGQRVLVIAAHPDDVDFGSAGTIAIWTDAGLEVSYCILTDGDAGGFDPKVPRSAIAGIRQDEQRKAAAVLGVTDVEFLGYPDGRLVVSFELRRDITRVIRRTRPDRVVVHSPQRDLRNVYGSHPDHLAAGEAALCAVYPDARNPFAHPELLQQEGLDAHTVREVWVVSANDKADRYIDITDSFDRKIAALRAHTSQTAHMTDLEERMRAWGSLQAQAAGLAEGRLAEGYLVLDTH
ncbi:MAG: PIG-L family deacetylase [Actinomycetota bacterium]|nr:PIG-L family deacetylase [Actinomycetota bacterium]MDQ3899062.1 PIG-L family deacetylase [Actinomycetota bacterium]